MIEKYSKKCFQLPGYTILLVLMLSIPIRIYPIMISITFHHYKILNDNILLLLPISRDIGNSNHNNITKGIRQMENLF
jgi:hypothetical protein